MEPLLCILTAATLLGTSASVFGCEDGQAGGERLDLNTMEWTKIHTMPVARAGCTCTAVANQVYIFGDSSAVRRSPHFC
jgi:hypothetical protein